MFKEFMEAMNERFHQDRSVQEERRVTDDFFMSFKRNDHEEQAASAEGCNT